MKLGDLLALFNDLPVRRAIGASKIVQALNARLPSTKQLTVENTGDEISAALGVLSTEDHVKLLLAEVDPQTGSMDVETVIPAQGVERLPRRADARTTAAIVFGGALVFIALMMAASVTYTTVKTGQMPDTETMDSIAHVIGDVIKIFSDGAQQHGPGSM